MGVQDGGGRLLHGDDTGAEGGEEGGEGADAGVGVQQEVRPFQTQAVPHEGGHALRLLGMDLEEGGGGDLEGNAE